MAKCLRKLALNEMMTDNVPERELVITRSGAVINSPSSVRAMYLKYKTKYLNVRAGLKEFDLLTWGEAKIRGSWPVKLWRKRKASGFMRPQTAAPIAWIENPLEQLKKLFPFTQNVRKEWEPHPIYTKARRLAAKGNGAALQKLARQHLQEV